MAINNYADLKQAVRGFLHRDDITDDAMDLANQFAASEISAKLKDWAIIGRTQLDDSLRFGDPVATDSPEYLLPEDFYSIDAIYYGDVDDTFGWATGTNISSPYVNSDRQVLRQLKNSGSRVDPTSYRLTGSLNTVIFDAIPPVGAVFQLVYFRYLYGYDSPADDASFNQPLLNYPELFVYAMCQHLAIAFQDIEMAQVYAQQFDSAVQTTTNRYIEARDKGPATIQGASSWV